MIFGTIHMLVNVYLFPIPSQFALLFLFLYLFYSAISFHQRKSFWVLIKYFLIGVISILLYLVLGFGFAILMVSI